MFGRFRYSSSETSTSAGLIEPIDRTHHGIRLVQQPEKEEGIPFLGTIAAGRPIEAVPQPEYLQVPDELLGRKPCYVLKVHGDSMIEESILDGDYVVIEQRDSANNGEIVVALVRTLLNVIADTKPDSLQDLAKATGRQPSNLSRTLKTLEGYGFVELKKENKKIRPVAKATQFEIQAA